MIISCSRRTDIPAFYSDWFFHRIREGYVQVRNPMNPKQVRRISLAPHDVDCLVFWTKDPSPMLNRLHLLGNYAFYFQFTLTPYGKDIEPHLPRKAEIVDTFLRLSDKIGHKRVIWRYDPILLSKNITVDYHLNCFDNLARRLSRYTDTCVISFMDTYRHILDRMADLAVRPPDKTEMPVVAAGIAQIARIHRMKVETCAEEINLDDQNIGHGKCIDDRLISELTGRQLTVMKDKSQRVLCGCVASADIGVYNTCRHGCRYCYANISQKKIEMNRSLHYSDSPLLIGDNS